MSEGIQKPNCSTCIYGTTQKFGFVSTCKITGREMNTYLTDLISEIGCLSHPGAREYLMAPVIEYLEQYLITETFGGYSETDVAYSKLARETIALIRGVK